MVFRQGNVFYFDHKNKASSWEHPLDSKYAPGCLVPVLHPRLLLGRTTGGGRYRAKVKEAKAKKK